MIMKRSYFYCIGWILLLSKATPLLPYSSKKQCCARHPQIRPLPSPVNLTLETQDWHAGFFACFRSVIGALDYFEKNKSAHNYKGFYVNFIGGLYADPTLGLNWWEHYFEPIPLPFAAGAASEKIPASKIGALAFAAGSTISRERSYELIQKYIRIKPHIQKQVTTYLQDNFTGRYVIGVHYRGTDKSSEAPRISYEQFFEQIQKIINTIATPYTIFIATDEQLFIEEAQQLFNDVIFIDCERSIDGLPLHYDRIGGQLMYHAHPYKHGESALLDCLLLSHCNVIIRMQSNLSSAASDFNPKIPLITLNSCYHWQAR